MVVINEKETVKQNIDKTLNLIYNLGDRDECSDKHIGHCLAAIASGKTYQDVVAYKTPWKNMSNYVNKDEYEWVAKGKSKRLKSYWKTIQEEYQNLGQAVFHEIIEEFQEPFYFECLVYYCPDENFLQSICSPHETDNSSEEEPIAQSSSGIQFIDGILI